MNSYYIFTISDCVNLKDKRMTKKWMLGLGFISASCYCHFVWENSNLKKFNNTFFMYYRAIKFVTLTLVNFYRYAEL